LKMSPDNVIMRIVSCDMGVAKSQRGEDGYMGQQESIGKIEVILLREKGHKRGKRLLGGPEAEYERHGGVQTIDLFLGYCVPIGRDRNALNTSIPASICPVYRRWFLIVDAGDISRCHAIATFDGSRGCYQLTDLGSTNGTYLCETLNRAKRGCCTITGLELPGQPPRSLHLFKGDRLEANQSGDWYDGQYCFLGESALLRLQLLKKPQVSESGGGKREKGVTSTLIVGSDGKLAPPDSKR
jgi:hypothetical protein